MSFISYWNEVKKRLEPCRFCGGGAHLSTRDMKFIGQNELGDKKTKIGAQVICNRCKARGPLYTGIVINPYSRSCLRSASFQWITEHAIAAWNAPAGGAMGRGHQEGGCA